MALATRFNKTVFYALLFCVGLYLYTLAVIRGPEPPPQSATVAPRTDSVAPTRANLAHEDIIYILQWPDAASPLDLLGNGLERLDDECEYRNCYVTDKRDFFIDIRDFDAIVFNGKLLSGIEEFPARRHPRQRYIFAAAESARNYPACGARWDGFFNWTWTYRLDSDVRWTYLEARDAAGRAAAPRERPRWLAASDPVSAELADSLRTKTKAAAWFVTNCRTSSRREQYVAQLQVELKKYGLQVDVYGACGSLSCPRSLEPSCMERLKQDYYFYLSFENSFADDYVTEKLLTALQNNAVPIVYGGANYSRFLPPGSYLDARALPPAELASVMGSLIADRRAYADLHRWRSHYTYRATLAGRSVCGLCAALNNATSVGATSVHKEFRRWWNPPGACQ